MFLENMRIHMMLFVLSSTGIVILLLYQPDYNKYLNFSNKKCNTTKCNTTNGRMVNYDKSNEEIKILIWHNFLGKWYWDFQFRRLLSKQCPENRCKIVHNKTEFNTADAVILSGDFMMYNKYEVPKTHPAKQLWIMYTLEALNANLKNKGPVLSRIAGLGINWTMTFRKDADVVVPYGLIHNIDVKNINKSYTYQDIWSRKKDKKKIASWMVTHCKTNAQRETYVTELSKYVKVDIYGKCGKLKCGCTQIETKRAKGLPCPKEKCTALVNSYFFYLAFENNICREYVTERLYRSLQRDVVPVVMGGGPYSLIAPPHSYINALDFPTPKHLADYLQKVASDPVLYNKYFEWKQYYTVELGHPYSTRTCNLCEKLHQFRSKDILIEPKKNLTEWFRNAQCEGSWQEVLSKKFMNN